MNDLGIILDFSVNLITINIIVLPMQSINELPTSNKKALGYNNSLAKNQEPKSTELATQRIVEILDAKYKKADLSEIVKNDCKQLNPEEHLQLLEVAPIQWLSGRAGAKRSSGPWFETALAL